MSELLFISCINNDLTTMKSLIQHKADINGYCNLFDDTTNQYITFNNNNHNNTNNNNNTNNDNDGNNNNTQSTITTTPIQIPITTLPKGDNHNTLVHAAILSNNVEMLKYVINDLRINNFKHLDYCGNESLLIAIQSNKYASTKFLVEEYDLNINDFDPEYDFLCKDIPQYDIFIYLINKFNINLSTLINYRFLYRFVNYGFFSHFKYIVETYKLTKDLFYHKQIGDLLSTAIHSNHPNSILFIDYLVSKYEFELDFNAFHYSHKEKSNKNFYLPYLIHQSFYTGFKHFITNYQYNPHIINNDGDTILHTFASKQFVIGQAPHIIQQEYDMIDYCIKTLQIDPNQPNKHGITPIYAIFKAGHLTWANNNIFIHYLLQNYTINCTPPPILTSTFILFHRILQAKECTSKSIEALHQYGQVEPYINQLNDQNETPLEIAALYCTVDVIQALLQYKANVPIYDEENPGHVIQLLHKATKNDDPDVLDLLLQHPNINGLFPQYEIESLLFQTIHGQTDGTARLLIEKYNVDYTTIKNECNENLLQCCFPRSVYGGTNINSKLFQYLINTGQYDVETTYSTDDGTSFSSLLLLALSNECLYSIDDIKCIVESGGDINRFDSSSELNVFQLALELKRSDIIGYLLDSGCELDTITVWDSHSILTRLYTDLGEIEFQSMLRNHSRLHHFIHQLNESNQTFLHHMMGTYPCSISMLKQIFSFQPKLNIQDSHGLTPLILGAKRGINLDCVKYIILKTDRNGLKELIGQYDVISLIHLLIRARPTLTRYYDEDISKIIEHVIIKDQLLNDDEQV